MISLRLFLLISTITIFLITIIAINNQGIFWPEVFFGDILSLDWRSQFNVDFLIHLLLLATWIIWREGNTIKGYIFGFLSIFMGGMFGFLYILFATYTAKGNPNLILLGTNAK